MLYKYKNTFNINKLPKKHTILIKKNSMIKSIFSIDLSLNWLYICFIIQR